jgi:hypothetical protein
MEGYYRWINGVRVEGGVGLTNWNFDENVMTPNNCRFSKSLLSTAYVIFYTYTCIMYVRMLFRYYVFVNQEKIKEEYVGWLGHV